MRTSVASKKVVFRHHIVRQSKVLLRIVLRRWFVVTMVILYSGGIVTRTLLKAKSLWAKYL